MTLSHPAAVLNRLAEIENDLAERQNDYETAASTKARLTRDWDRRLAIARKKATGNDADGRKAAALIAAIEQDDLYDRLAEAEGTYEGCKAVVKLLETRATIGQSILKAQTREYSVRSAA